MKLLADEDDSSEVVGAVRGEGDELVADGHDAGGVTGARGATDGLVEAAGVAGDCGDLFGSAEEALADLLPRLVGGVGVEGVGGFGGE